MSIRKTNWISFLPAVIWTLIIIHLSTSGSIQMPFNWTDFLAIDKWGHLIFYGIHAGLLLEALEINGFFKTYRQRQIVAFIGSVALGTTMEIIQFTFYPNRYFEILDIIANIIGAYLGLRYFSFFLNFVKEQIGRIS